MTLELIALVGSSPTAVVGFEYPEYMKGGDRDG